MSIELLPGERLDRYELIRAVARGGMGEVWLARMSRSHGFEKRVALKTILARFARDPRFREMFLDEARLTVRIDHPNVAQVLDLGEHGGVLFIVMEWVDGPPLDVVLRRLRARGERVPVELALRIVADAAAGLNAAHEARDADGARLGIVHRDVSLQNILLTERGTVKVVDFGIARARAGLEAEAGGERVRGKAPYMAPEQAMGELVDARADVWGLGAVLFELLTGSPPVRTIAELCALVQGSAGIPTVDRANANVQAIVRRALSIDPGGRFATAAELQRALELALAEIGPPVTAADLARMLAAYVPRAIVADEVTRPTTAVRLLDDGVAIEHAGALGVARTLPGSSRLGAARTRVALAVKGAERRAQLTRELRDVCELVEGGSGSDVDAIVFDLEASLPSHECARVAVCEAEQTEACRRAFVDGRADAVILWPHGVADAQRAIEAARIRRARRDRTAVPSDRERGAQLREEARLRRLVDRGERRLDDLRRRRAEAENDARLAAVGELEVRRARALRSPETIVVYRTRRPEPMAPSADLATLLAAIETGASVLSEHAGEVVIVAPDERVHDVRDRLRQVRFVAGAACAVEPEADEPFLAAVARARSACP